RRAGRLRALAVRDLQDARQVQPGRRDVRPVHRRARAEIGAGGSWGGARLPPNLQQPVLRFVLFRLLQSLVALAILSVVVFVLARATGDPLHMILPMNASEEDYANARKYLGLDRPYVEQYFSFVGRAVTGDFGTSIRARRPVIELLRERLPNSVKLARLKGVAERKVVWVHALKNALIPVVTFAGIYFAILVTTAIVVETVFAWPGLGRLAYDGITSRDFPVIQAVVLTTATIVAAVNLGVDCLYAV